MGVNTAGLGTHLDVGVNGGRYDGLQQDAVIGIEADINSADDAKKLLRSSLEEAASEYKNHNGGSTATVAAITPDGKLTIAQIGDSTVMVFVEDIKTGQIESHNLTVDQSPSAEFDRIQRDGGFVFQDRVNGQLAVGRAIGDRAVGPGVSSTPDINTYDLNNIYGEDKRVFVVVGSDGLTDYASIGDLSKNVKGQNSAQSIAESMVEDAKSKFVQLRPGSQSDNISASVLEFDPNSKSASFIGVMDGHGPGGEIVSRGVQNNLEHAFRAFVPRAQLDNKQNFVEENQYQVNKNTQGAIDQSREFNSNHRISTYDKIEYGYMDGGRGLKFRPDGSHLTDPTREIIVVKSPAQDPPLKAAIDDVKKQMSGMSSVREKAEFLNEYVADLLKENNPSKSHKIIN